MGGMIPTIGDSLAKRHEIERQQFLLTFAVDGGASIRGHRTN